MGSGFDHTFLNMMMANKDVYVDGDDCVTEALAKAEVIAGDAIRAWHRVDEAYVSLAAARGQVKIEAAARTEVVRRTALAKAASSEFEAAIAAWARMKRAKAGSITTPNFK
jgi:hypothetical protein